MTGVSYDGRQLFAYGTLMFPAVIKSVIGRIPENRPAVIKGYRRLEVAGELFPGLIRENDESVEGVVYANIGSDEWERLTAFEDDFYELQEVTVDCLGTNTGALAYVVPTSRKSVLSDKVWSPDFFRENHLAGFACQRQSNIELEAKHRDGHV
jgi:gamma-glutamylcyclotransferase (GGCT)/AIG2-like uncharacterized protein YtfP